MVMLLFQAYVKRIEVESKTIYIAFNRKGFKIDYLDHVLMFTIQVTNGTKCA